MNMDKIQISPSATARAFANALNAAKSYVAKLEAIGPTFGPSTPASMLAALNSGIAEVQASWAGLCTSDPVTPTPGTTLSRIAPAGDLPRGGLHDNEATTRAMEMMRQ